MSATESLTNHQNQGLNVRVTTDGGVVVFQGFISEDDTFGLTKTEGRPTRVALTAVDNSARMTVEKDR
jgi:hypothetical protein